MTPFFIHDFQFYRKYIFFVKHIQHFLLLLAFFWNLKVEYENTSNSISFSFFQQLWDKYALMEMSWAKKLDINVYIFLMSITNDKKKSIIFVPCNWKCSWNVNASGKNKRDFPMERVLG